MSLVRALALALTLCAATAPGAAAQGIYQKAPKAVRDVLDAPPFPHPVASPPNDAFLLLRGDPYPPISDLSEPVLRLAGVRLNPKTNGQHRAPYWRSITYLPFRDGVERPVSLPPGARVGLPIWSPDGTKFAFSITRTDGIELWTADITALEARRLEGVRINAALGSGMKWLSDSKTILVRQVLDGRGAAPSLTAPPEGPQGQEASGKHGIGSTYETRDVLKGPRDEELFEYYFTSQLALVDVARGTITKIGEPGLYWNPAFSPDGKYLLVERVHRPYSYLHTHTRFPRRIEIWDRTGTLVRVIADLPLDDQIPIQGVTAAPRGMEWRPTRPATLTWIEALDGGDPLAKVPHRDRIRTLAEPFDGEPAEMIRFTHRITDLWWGQSGSDAIVAEFDRERRWERVHTIRPDEPGGNPVLLFEQSVNEKYGDPGIPSLVFTPEGFHVYHQDGDWIWLYGNGATPQGERPFLDRFNVKTRKSERLFRSDPSHYEFYSGMINRERTAFITRRESPTEPPNFQVHTLGSPRSGAKAGEAQRVTRSRPLTRFPDPAPQLRGIRKEIVTYTRGDGVPLSFTLHLPPGYRKGTRLPTVVWAYPLEYSDAGTAGQVAGSEQRYTEIRGASPLFFLLQGYAVLYNTTMPVIAHPDSVYDDFVEQLVSSAKAAIDKAVAMGVTDPGRVGIMGHSHGGRMAATLLAHSDLFRAGIARSGAYNQTIVPFGFQGERRTFFEAPDTYLRVSAFRYADKINEPLLLIHGEADANPGTIPFQSDLMYRAVVGTGGTARLVTLPLESHAYEARESIEHTLWEMISWFDRYVKNAKTGASP